MTAPTPINRAQLLTVSDVAQILKVDEQTVRRYIARGTLPARRLPGDGNRRPWRIRATDLEALLNAAA